MKKIYNKPKLYNKKKKKIMEVGVAIYHPNNRRD